MNKSKSFFCFFVMFLLSFFPQKMYAEVEQSDKNIADNEIVEDSANVGKGSEYLPNLDLIFRNPAFVNGLQLGTDALNKSVTSLMDSLFYSLLDNQFRFELTEESFFSYNLTRNLFNTPDGNYVVVDRLFLGPQYGKNIANIGKMPLFLGASGQVDILNIYLRSDVERLTRERELPYYRVLLNNWFGILPTLTQILPPSFNPNELYDPFAQFAEPFLFPISIEAFARMEEGSIRSYAVTGGISLSLDVSKEISQKVLHYIKNLGTDLIFPISILSQGTHRVNILKKSKTIAWVGISKEKTEGSSLELQLGGKVYILGNSLLPLPWRGIGAVISPFDAQFLDNDIKKKDILFEFDLSTKEGEKAYLQAIKGDFTQAKNLEMTLRKEKKQKASRIFQLRQDRKEKERVHSRLHNFFVYRIEDSKKVSNAEVEIVNFANQYYVLEASNYANKLNWDVLFGSKEQKITTNFEINVDKINGKNGDKEFVFRGDSPFNLTFTIFIQDQYMDVKNYKDYLKLLAAFSELDLSSIDDISGKDLDYVKDYEAQAISSSTDDINDFIHPSTYLLGKFNSTAQVQFSTAELKKMLLLEEKVFVEASKDVFSFKGRKVEAITPVSGAKYFIKNALSAPFFAELKDRYYFEYWACYEAFANMRKAKTPLELQGAFHDLLKTDYPFKILELLYKLGNLRNIPRKINFFVKPAPDLPSEIKDKLLKLNEKVFRSKINLPQVADYKQDKEKLNAFYPQELKSKPLEKAVKKIELLEKNTYLTARIFLEKKYMASQKESLLFFIRIESSANLHLGTLLLAEQVLEVKIPKIDEISEEQEYLDFYLSGPRSPFIGYIYEKELRTASKLKISLSVSLDAKIWSFKHVAILDMPSVPWD